jgi:peptidoglycan hydrolase-like protein with peptidoglycan-binding domain
VDSVAAVKDRKLPTWLIVVAVLVFAGIVAAILVNGRGGNGGTTATTAATAAADPAVVDLQQTMTRLGYYSGPIDGVYGPATTAAVTEMQKALGVPADGVFGPSTDAAMKGKGKDVVEQIQTELAKYGYYTGPIDGQYGPATTEAVKKLQTDLGITADGQVGAATVDAFNTAVANGTLQQSNTSTAGTTTTTTSTETTSTTATTTSTSGTTT